MIDIENKVYALEQEYKEKEFELFRTNERNIIRRKDLKVQLSKINKEIETERTHHNEKAIKYNVFVRKREELETMIQRMSKDPLGDSIQMAYQNYLMTLENLLLEQSKYISHRELKHKELKVNKLVEQVKHRDDLLNNMRDVLNKKGVGLKYDENIKSIDNIGIKNTMPVLPRVSRKGIFKNNTKSNSAGREMTGKIKSKNTNSGSPRVLNYAAYNHTNIIKEKTRIKTKAYEIVSKARKNQLTSIKMNIINELYPNSKVVYLHDKSKHNFNPNKIQIQTNLSLNDSNRSANLDISHESRKTRELDKKVKKALYGRNINERYKNSPYIVR